MNQNFLLFKSLSGKIFQGVGLFRYLPLGVFVALVSCPNEIPLGRVDGSPNIDSDDVSSSYCVQLNEIKVGSGGFGLTDIFSKKGPDLYGRVCVSTSADEALLAEPEEGEDPIKTADKLANCRNLWYERDDNSFAPSLLLTLVATLDDDNKQIQVLQGDPSVYEMFCSGTTTLDDKGLPMCKSGTDTTDFAPGSHPQDKKYTVELSTLNHRIVIVFVSVVDDDGIIITSLPDEFLKEENSETSQGHILTVAQNEFPENTSGSTIERTVVFEHDNGGTVKFFFKIKDGACGSESEEPEETQ